MRAAPDTCFFLIDHVFFKEVQGVFFYSLTLKYCYKILSFDVFVVIFSGKSLIKLCVRKIQE